MQYNQEDYISIVYNDKRAPKTDYPKQLIEYLCTRFNVQKNSKLLELGSGSSNFLNGFQKVEFHCEGLDQDVLSVNNEYELQVKKLRFNKRKISL